MDRYKRTLNVVKALNDFNKGELEDFKFLEIVCEYFDYIKYDNIDEADKKFLIYLSNKAGVPHYYDILNKFNKDNILSIDDESFDLKTFSSILYESSLHTDETSKLHKYQKEVLDLFRTEEQNRFFLSASTSFRKTHLVYEIIKKMKYKNIVLIFPSIALLSENLEKIKYKKINLPLDYKVHTLSDIDEENYENNIFIFTPERFLSFLDQNKTEINIDFIFVDEVYKIDNGYIIDDVAKENERDIAYRMAIFYGLKKFVNIDILLAGPYIEIFQEDSELYNPSFDMFLSSYNIIKLLKNNYEVVKVNHSNVENENKTILIDNIKFDFKSKKTKKSKIQELLDKIINHTENAIVYCNTKAYAEKVAIDYKKDNIDTSLFKDFLNHLKEKYDENWIIIKALEKGIGVHHGVVPKYIQKEIINLFNNPMSGIDVLTSTTTITEGVNTTTKNMIVYKSMKGSGMHGKELLTFDAKNIAGRAGRFMEHYTGRTITLDSDFLRKINEPGEQITHKNYDPNQEKNEIDDEMTPGEYIDDRMKERIKEIFEMQNERGLPDEILSKFKVITKRNKIIIYDKILELNNTQKTSLSNLISKLNAPEILLDKAGFQVIIDIIEEHVENEKLSWMIRTKFQDRYSPNSYSVLFVSLNNYLKFGFQGVYDFYLQSAIKNRNKNAVNSSMRESANLIFNTFKYQLVKYLGVFNLMYKFHISKSSEIDIDDVNGIDRLLVKLEYNAFSPEARIASDYGVPTNIINYFDLEDEALKKLLYEKFDSYEKELFNKIKPIVEEV